MFSFVLTLDFLRNFLHFYIPRVSLSQRVWSLHVPHVSASSSGTFVSAFQHSFPPVSPWILTSSLISDSASLPPVFSLCRLSVYRPCFWFNRLWTLDLWMEYCFLCPAAWFRGRWPAGMSSSLSCSILNYSSPYSKPGFKVTMLEIIIQVFKPLHIHILQKSLNLDLKALNLDLWTYSSLFWSVWTDLSASSFWVWSFTTQV